MLNRLVRAAENFLPHGGFARVTAQPRQKYGGITAESPQKQRENSASAGRVGGRT